MPSGESLLRHIEYTKEHLTKVWGVKRLEVNFSPDTFGHRNADYLAMLDQSIAEAGGFVEE